MLKESSGVASSISGGGGGGGTYSYIRVLHNQFLLKLIVFTICEHEYVNMSPHLSSGSPLKESVNDLLKVVSFLWEFRFPTTANVDRVGWN